MNPDEKSARISRREMMKTAAGMAVGVAGIKTISLARECCVKPGTVGDRLWVFGVPANADYTWHQRRSLMTPAEGAFYLGVPNILIIQAIPRGALEDSEFKPFTPPFEQYAIALRPLKRMCWSIVGSSGYTTPEYRKQVMQLAETTANCVGLYMDDFFYTDKKHLSEGRRAALTIDELKGIREQARGPRKKLDIWVTFYTHLLNLPLSDYLKLIDVVTLWTWKSEDLKNLRANFQKTEVLAPHLKKTLGCYFYDFTTRQPLTVAQMENQCEIGLEWLRAGKIEGIVFLGNTEEDMGFESVEWTRNWIQKVGDISLS